jgi:hypothetical protein
VPDKEHALACLKARRRPAADLAATGAVWRVFNDLATPVGDLRRRVDDELRGCESTPTAALKIAFRGWHAIALGSNGRRSGHRPRYHDTRIYRHDNDGRTDLVGEELTRSAG